MFSQTKYKVGVNIVLLLTVLTKICSERKPDIFGVVTETEAEVQCHRCFGQISDSLIPWTPRPVIKTLLRCLFFNYTTYEGDEGVQPRSAKANHRSHVIYHGQRRARGKSFVSLLSHYRCRLCPPPPWCQPFCYFLALSLGLIWSYRNQI